MVHLRARAYAPNLGRFIQPDPIGTAGGINLYAYAGGDPMNLRDVLGLLAGPPMPPDPDEPVRRETLIVTAHKLADEADPSRMLKRIEWALSQLAGCGRSGTCSNDDVIEYVDEIVCQAPTVAGGEQTSLERRLPGRVGLLFRAGGTAAVGYAFNSGTGQLTVDVGLGVGLSTANRKPKSGAEGGFFAGGSAPDGRVGAAGGFSGDLDFSAQAGNYGAAASGRTFSTIPGSSSTRPTIAVGAIYPKSDIGASLTHMLRGQFTFDLTEGTCQ